MPDLLDVVAALRDATPAERFAACRSSVGVDNVLYDVEDAACIKYADLLRHSNVVKALFTVSPNKTLPASMLQAAVQEIDKEENNSLSRRRTLREQRRWAAAEAGVLAALLSYAQPAVERAR